MRVVSRIRNKSFVKFTLFEHALITMMVVAGVPAIVFFGILMLGRRGGSDVSSDLLDTFFITGGSTFMLVVAAIALLLTSCFSASGIWSWWYPPKWMMPMGVCVWSCVGGVLHP